MSRLGGSTAPRAAGGSSAAGAMASSSSTAPEGGTLGAGPVGGAWGPSTKAGASGLGATVATTAPEPNGAATPLGRLYAGTLPVHPHTDDATGGVLDAYAVVDHTHPEQVVGYYILSTLTAMVEPQTGRFRVNTGDSTTATQLAMHHTSSKGTDAQAFFQAMAAGDALWFQQQPEYERWVRYRVTAAPTVNPTWSLVPVAVESAGLAIQPNQTAFVQLTMGAGGGGGGVSPHGHTDGATGGLVDYARLVVAATPPAAPGTPSDAFWLNPTEEA